MMEMGLGSIMSSDKTSSKLWEWFGKIAMLVGAIVGFIFIYQTVNPDAPELRVQGEYYKWPDIGMPANAESFLRLGIENIGKQSAKNVRIDLPFDGLFILDGDTELKDFTKSIQIGDLQPSDKKSVEVWSVWRSFYPTSEVKVIHDNGTSEVSYPTQVRGMTAWVIENSFLLVFMLLGVVMIGLNLWAATSRKSTNT
jgi:hypothetical protein